MHFHTSDVFLQKSAVQQWEHAFGCIIEQPDIFSYTSCIKNHCSRLEISHYTSQLRSLASAAAEVYLSCQEALGLKPIADHLIRGSCAAAIL